MRMPLLPVFLLALRAQLSSRGSGAKTAMFRGEPAHTGVYDAPGVPQFTKIKWQFHTEGPSALFAGRDVDTVYVGSSDHFLYAIDRNTGAEKWKFKTEGRITSSPAVSGWLVYFRATTGMLTPSMLTTGAQKWKFALPGERRFAAAHLHGATPSRRDDARPVRLLSIFAGRR